MQKYNKKQKQQNHVKVKHNMQFIKNYLQNDKIKTVYDYSRKILDSNLNNDLLDYSPSHLSKFVFNEQLQKAQTIFKTFQNEQCGVEQFLLLMIQIMNFPFEKWPFYLIAVKDMFYEILDKKSNTITYAQFFKYIIGQVLDIKQQQKSTNFQIHFEELKKQDYLLHDNGIKKIYYSNGQKIYIVLDMNVMYLKIYSKEMKFINKFYPNNQRHAYKYPHIVYFTYSELTNRLGLILSDNTFSLINLQNFLSKPKSEFIASLNNELIVPLHEKFLNLYYLNMTNTWLLISQTSKLYIFDSQKYHDCEPDYFSQVQLQISNNQIVFKEFIEIINLGMLCLIFGNEIYFYDENFEKQKHQKYVHGTQIEIVKYNEQLNNFFICGEEKIITVLSITKSISSFNITYFHVNSKHQICAYDYFQLFATLVVIDKNNDVRLFDINKGTCYQIVSYSNIVKNPQRAIKLLKISKNEFALYQTYILLLTMQRVAIQKQIQYIFNNSTYYNPYKFEFYFSVNSQIICFSLLNGQIRKTYNLETSNVPKHHKFILTNDTNMFILDHQQNLYDVYLKNELKQGEYKNYKKKINIKNIIDVFYNENNQNVFIISNDSIHTIKNDNNNIYTVLSTLNIIQSQQIIQCKYNQNNQSLQILTTNQKFLQISLQTYKIIQFCHFQLPQNKQKHQDINIISFDIQPINNIIIFLTNMNQIYFVSKQQHNHYIHINIQNYLPNKIKYIQWKNLKVSKPNHQPHPNTQQTSNPLKQQTYIILTNTTGFIFEINITKILKKHFKIKQQTTQKTTQTLKDTHTINLNKQPINSISLIQNQQYLLNQNQYHWHKPHEKQIVIAQHIYIHNLYTLTISIDGSIKFYHAKNNLFHIKLPNFQKITWNMSQIEEVHQKRSVQQLKKILQTMSFISKQKEKPQSLLKKINQKISQQSKQIKKFNIQQPIQIDIQRKDIQDIIYKNQNINWYLFQKKHQKRSLTDKVLIKTIDKIGNSTHRSIGKVNDRPRTDRTLPTRTQMINKHPWRNRSEFQKIIQKASPQNKYKTKMPQDLLSLRTSLDMLNNHTNFPKQKVPSQLKILPQLKNYTPQKPIIHKQYPSSFNQYQPIFQSCLYNKKIKQIKKPNQFDQIDKEFLKKWNNINSKKIVIKQKKYKNIQFDISPNKPKNKFKTKQSYNPNSTTKCDTIKQIKHLFENHNRQINLNKKGRLIKIPQIYIKKQDLFFNNDSY